MSSKQQSCNSLSGTISGLATVALTFAIVFALTVVLSQSAQAQTYTVVHNFTDGEDGGCPAVGLTMDPSGNFYGTTQHCVGCTGTVFKLSHSGSGWVLTTLYSFAGGSDGSCPSGRVALARDGTLYGTTTYDGSGGFGTVFRLSPWPTAPKSVLAPWSKVVLYSFTGGSDGAWPEGDLTLDQSGNIYGTTPYGGYYGQGAIYELAPSSGGWTETVLYSPLSFPGRSGAQGRCCL